jgi:DNA-binding transcriptional ArsR family regulator
MTNRPSFHAEFRAGDGGKPAVYMTRSVNTRDEKDSWSEITMATVAVAGDRRGRRVLVASGTGGGTGAGAPLVDIVQPCGILNHMVVDRSPRLDLVFHALAHPARRAIIRQLSGGERNLSELASPLKMTFPAATKHVRVLERAKLVRRRVVGRQHLCRLRAAPLKEATLWTEQFRRNWEARFEALDALLDDMKSEEQSRSRRR